MFICYYYKIISQIFTSEFWVCCLSIQYFQHVVFVMNILQVTSTSKSLMNVARSQSRHVSGELLPCLLSTMCSWTSTHGGTGEKKKNTPKLKNAIQLNSHRNMKEIKLV